MGPREAFDAIQSAIAEDGRKRLVDARYWEDAFGNFIVAFEEDGRPQSIVNDRFELVVCDDLKGDQGCRTILPSFREADAETLLSALGL